MLITETLDWRDIVHQLPVSTAKTLVSCCQVKSYKTCIVCLVRPIQEE